MKKVLVKQEEIELLNNKFKGKLAGKSWSYEQNLDGLIRTRIIMIIMIFLVFYPVLTNYLFHGFFSMDLLIERLVYSVFFLIGSLLFNKFRNISIVLALIPSILIFMTYLTSPNGTISILGYTGAIVLLIGSGLYHAYKVNILKKELESSLLENQLLGEIK